MEYLDAPNPLYRRTGIPSPGSSWFRSRDERHLDIALKTPYILNLLDYVHPMPLRTPVHPTQPPRPRMSSDADPVLLQTGEYLVDTYPVPCRSGRLRWVVIRDRRRY